MGETVKPDRCQECGSDLREVRPYVAHGAGFKLPCASLWHDAVKPETIEAKAPCGHAAASLRYDRMTRTISCTRCSNPPKGLFITEDEAQMDVKPETQGDGTVERMKIRLPWAIVTGVPISNQIGIMDTRGRYVPPSRIIVIVHALADALAEKEQAHAETRGLIRDLTTALENRNRENASLRKRAEAAERQRGEIMGVSERLLVERDEARAWADKKNRLGVPPWRRE